MDNKKKHITVRVNNQIKEYPISHDRKAEEEIAATVDNGRDSSKKDYTSSSFDENPPKIKVLERPYQSKKSFFASIPKFKHLFIAGFSAILVGIVLGVIMLNLLSGVDTDDDAEQANGSTNAGEAAALDEEAVPAGGSSNDDTSSGDVVPVEFEGFTPHVVQIGVFSSEEQANDGNLPFIEKNINPVIWEKENQYFVFVGLAFTKEQADQLETSIKSAVPEAKDAFDKTWAVEPANKETPEAEGNWVKEGITLWEEAVTNYSEKSTISSEISEKLTNWHSNSPEQLTESGEAFKGQYKAFIDSVTKSEATIWEIQTQFISVLQAYESYISI